jgi:hypothetical protein
MPFQHSLRAHCGSLRFIRIHQHLIPRNIVHLRHFVHSHKPLSLFYVSNFVNGPNATACYIHSRRKKLSSLCRYMSERKGLGGIPFSHCTAHILELIQSKVPCQGPRPEVAMVCRRRNLFINLDASKLMTYSSMSFYSNECI